VTLYQLKVFIVVARLGSFQRAAESLTLAASSISGHVKNLEAAVSLRLFERGSGRREIRLTEAGRVLARTCDEIFGALDVGFSQMETLRQGGRQIIRFAAGTSFFGYYLAPSHRAFQRAYPDIDLRVSIAFRQAILTGLRNGSLDLGVVSWAPDDPDIQAVPFVWFDLVLVGPTGHPLSHDPPHSFGSLRTERFVLPALQNAGRRILDELASQHGIQIQDILELDEADARFQAVSHGYGITVASYPTVAPRIDAQQLSLLHVDGFPVRQVWHLVHARRRLPEKVNKMKNLFLQWQWGGFSSGRAQ